MNPPGGDQKVHHPELKYKGTGSDHKMSSIGPAAGQTDPGPDPSLASYTENSGPVLTLQSPERGPWQSSCTLGKRSSGDVATGEARDVDGTSDGSTELEVKDRLKIGHLVREAAQALPASIRRANQHTWMMSQIQSKLRESSGDGEILWSRHNEYIKSQIAIECDRKRLSSDINQVPLPRTEATDDEILAEVKTALQPKWSSEDWEGVSTSSRTFIVNLQKKRKTEEEKAGCAQKKQKTGPRIKPPAPPSDLAEPPADRALRTSLSYMSNNKIKFGLSDAQVAGINKYFEHHAQRLESVEYEAQDDQFRATSPSLQQLPPKVLATVAKDRFDHAWMPDLKLQVVLALLRAAPAKTKYQTLEDYARKSGVNCQDKMLRDLVEGNHLEGLDAEQAIRDCRDIVEQLLDGKSLRGALDMPGAPRLTNPMWLAEMEQELKSIGISEQDDSGDDVRDGTCDSFREDPSEEYEIDHGEEHEVDPGEEHEVDPGEEYVGWPSPTPTPAAAETLQAERLCGEGEHVGASVVSVGVEHATIDREEVRNLMLICVKALNDFMTQKKVSQHRVLVRDGIMVHVNHRGQRTTPGNHEVLFSPNFKAEAAAQIWKEVCKHLGDSGSKPQIEVKMNPLRDTYNLPPGHEHNEEALQFILRELGLQSKPDDEKDAELVIKCIVAICAQRPTLLRPADGSGQVNVQAEAQITDAIREFLLRQCDDDLRSECLLHVITLIGACGSGSRGSRHDRKSGKGLALGASAGQALVPFQTGTNHGRGSGNTRAQRHRPTAHRRPIARLVPPGSGAIIPGPSLSADPNSLFKGFIC